MAAAKKGLLAILGDGPKGPPSAGGDADTGDGKTEAAQSLLDAIADDDAAGVASAFQALYDHCAMAHGDDYEASADA